MQTDAVTAAIREVAARVIMPRHRRLLPGEIEAKHPGDLVTIADREAEKELTAFLSAADPQALIVGEEAAFDDPGLVTGLRTADRAWVIDPVDGTNNFARGEADFGVMVAELRGGEVVRGWIWQPVHRRMFVAERGAGVECNADALPPLAAPHDPVRGRVPRRLRRRPVAGFDLSPSSRSCAVDYPRLLVGEIDVLAYRHHRPWDHAAGTLMVTELGGHAATHPGIPWRPGVQGPVLLSASSASLWQRADAVLVTDEVLFGP